MTKGTKSEIENFQLNMRSIDMNLVDGMDTRRLNRSTTFKTTKFAASCTNEISNDESLSDNDEPVS